MLTIDCFLEDRASFSIHSVFSFSNSGQIRGRNFCVIFVLLQGLNFGICSLVFFHIVFGLFDFLYIVFVGF